MHSFAPRGAFTRAPKCIHAPVWRLHPRLEVSGCSPRRCIHTRGEVHGCVKEVHSCVPRSAFMRAEGAFNPCPKCIHARPRCIHTFVRCVRAAREIRLRRVARSFPQALATIERKNTKSVCREILSNERGSKRNLLRDDSFTSIHAGFRHLIGPGSIPFSGTSTCPCELRPGLAGTESQTAARAMRLATFVRSYRNQERSSVSFRGAAPHRDPPLRPGAAGG